MPIRILIADDNAAVRTAMRHVLESVDDWDIVEAEHGEEAVAKAEEIRPSLVILDLVMPILDGLRASREIAKLLPDVPILLHTLYFSLEVLIEAQKSGVRKIVPKSDSSALVSAVQDILHPQPHAALESASEPTSFAMKTIRRTEDKIHELCNQLFAMKDEDNEADAPTFVELREALHQHIEQLRARVAGYPVVVDRRVRNAIQAPDMPSLENPSTRGQRGRQNSPSLNNKMPEQGDRPPTRKRKTA